MAASIILAIAVTLLAQGCRAAGPITRMPPPDFTPPWFCHSINCPPFTVENDNVAADVELRRYAAGLWVATNISDTSYDAAVGTGFKRLFDYISGDNEGSMKVDMTAPVRVRLTPGPGPFCKDDFTVAFYLPWTHQAGGKAAPAPKDPKVFLQRSPEAAYYVLAYSGYTTQSKVLDKANELLAKLDAANAEYDASVIYSAGYDSPFRLINRHNEVWVPAGRPAQGLTRGIRGPLRLSC
ncbi:heme-binding protein 2-like protein [Haematococcus lacustris]